MSNAQRLARVTGRGALDGALSCEADAVLASNKVVPQVITACPCIELQGQAVFCIVCFSEKKPPALPVE